MGEREQEPQTTIDHANDGPVGEAPGSDKGDAPADGYAAWVNPSDEEGSRDVKEPARPHEADDPA